MAYEKEINPKDNCKQMVTWF